MADLTGPDVKGFAFHYNASPQGSPTWLAIKRGRIGASSLDKWLAVAKRPDKNGVHKPLKSRTDYEAELQFERQFNTSFQRFVTGAMTDGIEFEDWVAQQYAETFGVELEQVGCWYNEFIAVSPDRHIVGANAGIEIKLLKDTSFTGVMTHVQALRDNDQEAMADNKSVTKHWMQMQAQMWATGWDYVDYVPLNMNSRKFATIRVRRDEAFIAEIAEKVQEPITAPKFPTGAVHNIIGDVPSSLIMPGETDDTSDGGWAA